MSRHHMRVSFTRAGDLRADRKKVRHGQTTQALTVRAHAEEYPLQEALGNRS